MGNFEGKALHKSVTKEVGAGYGADRPVTYIKGREWMAYEFLTLRLSEHFGHLWAFMTLLSLIVADI